ncbi:DUF2785 domain-containing protein [Planococcus sp. FY231025]|uniref:DUF2785 domain-containing protein n=1 Tax=Planococcus sp. FY231025 TaxID=3455699 RepID=UPI003F919371
MLKERLKEINAMPMEELQRLNGQQRAELTAAMLEEIGSIDEELRDELVYSTFFRLAAEEVLTDRELASILDVCLDENHLFLKISEPSEDAVFTRSFSSLVIALVLFQDKTRKFPPTAKVEQVFRRSVEYLQREQDIRGFVEGKGWAHSIAHGADMLAEAAGHPGIDLDCAEESLAAVESCLFKQGQYNNEEDDRLIFVIEALIAKGLSDERLAEWIAVVFEKLQEIHEKEKYSAEFFRNKTNILNFAKTLYFRLVFRGENPDTKERITENLEHWHGVLYGRPS